VLGSRAGDAARALRTGEVARLAGVSPDTVRVYERRGLLPRPPRTSRGYRQYTPAAVDRIRLVRRALALGFTLEELHVVLGARDRGEAPCRVVRTLAAEKLEAVEGRIEDLVQLRDRIRRVLADWDARLARAPRDRPVGLLHALADLVPDGSPSPLTPRRRRSASVPE
jgi:DNA-binding transcriptional MerR regulator